jgi:hypothetical protein
MACNGQTEKNESNKTEIEYVSESSALIQVLHAQSRFVRLSHFIGTANLASVAARFALFYVKCKKVIVVKIKCVLNGKMQIRQKSGRWKVKNTVAIRFREIKYPTVDKPIVATISNAKGLIGISSPDNNE